MPHTSAPKKMVVRASKLAKLAGKIRRFKPTKLVIIGKGDVQISALNLPHTDLVIKNALLRRDKNKDVVIENSAFKSITSSNDNRLAVLHSEAREITAPKAQIVHISHAKTAVRILDAKSMENLYVSETDIDDMTVAPKLKNLKIMGSSTLAGQNGKPRQIANLFISPSIEAPLSKDANGIAQTTSHVLAYNLSTKSILTPETSISVEELLQKKINAVMKENKVDRAHALQTVETGWQETVEDAVLRHEKNAQVRAASSEFLGTVCKTFPQKDFHDRQVTLFKIETGKISTRRAFQALLDQSGNTPVLKTQ